MAANEFLKELHFFLYQLINHLSNILAFFSSKTFELSLQPRVEIDGQAQLRSFSVEFSSHTFGKVILSFHNLFPLVLFGFGLCSFPC